MFDDTNFEHPASPQWADAITMVSRRFNPDRTGGGPVGIDALAWYASFHNDPARWGIYIPLSSLPLIDHLQFSELRLPRPLRWRLVWDLLLAHEIVHFAVDYACAWFELLYRAPIRRALCDRIAGRFAKDALAHRSHYLEVEESLANGNILRQVCAPAEPEVAEAVRDFVRRQPPGYCDGERAETDEGRRELAAETLRSYLAVWSGGWNIDPGNPALDLMRLIPLPGESGGACPVRIVNDLETIGIPRHAVQVIACVQPIAETEAFRKSLDGLDPDHQRAWYRLKASLTNGIPEGADFKKWCPKGTWSLRVNASLRVHLQQPPAGESGQSWWALGIGPHPKMGHG